MTKKGTVGITSMYFNNRNLGGLLQSFAMCRELEHLGWQAEQLTFNTVNPPQFGCEGKEWLRYYLCRFAWLRKLFDRQFYDRKLAPGRSFRNTMRFSSTVPHSRYLGTRKALKRVGERYTCFLTGSDQVWSPIVLNQSAAFVYGLGFAAPAKGRIAYGVSIGAIGAAKGLEAGYSKLLFGIDHISVREESARNFLQPLTDKPIAVVLDPTLLLDRREWHEMVVGPKSNEPYLFAYLLEERENRHDQQIRRLADMMELPLRCIADETNCYLRPGSLDRQIMDAGPKEFLGEVRDAEMVLTNSFHGVVFSLTFRKPFWVLKRNREGNRVSMNSRLIDLLKMVGLEDRLLEDGEIPPLEKLRRPIDYDKVNFILEEKRAFSLKWLENALEDPGTVT